MRRAIMGPSGVVFTIAALGLYAGGCEPDCSTTFSCGPDNTTSGSGSSSSSSTGGGSLVCEQSPRDNAGSVADECGVFVKAGAAANGIGTMLFPLGSLAAAIDKAVMQGKKRIYACSGVLVEAVTVPAGLTLFGGLDCENGWAVTEDKTILLGPPDKIPLTLAGSAGAEQTRVEDFKVMAADAVTAGGSSIAAVAQEGAIVHFERCALTAGTGQKGADGESSSMPAPMTPGMSEAGKTACESATMNLGGSQSINDCVPYEDGAVKERSIGGQGGDGRDVNGTAGSPGDAVPRPAAPEGGGGSPGVACINGGDGDDGANGEDGAPGAPGLGVGALAADVGWVGVPGGDGKKGKPGQGGGGGGGKAGTAMAPSCAGASGGAGGVGGCGGWGGTGGKAGGSSIALVSINATITMTNVFILARAGGQGGAGGMNQVGASGGAGGAGGAGKLVGGTAFAAGCKGGSGGLGGRGGPGGGGAGGHSLGIAYMGQAPTVDLATFVIASDGGGAGGLGGDNNSKANNGDSGQAMLTLAFMPL
jgi:hypothetical protein